MDLPDVKLNLWDETRPHSRAWHYVIKSWRVTGQARPGADPNCMEGAGRSTHLSAVLHFPGKTDFQTK